MYSSSLKRGAIVQRRIFVLAVALPVAALSSAAWAGPIGGIKKEGVLKYGQTFGHGPLAGPEDVHALYPLPADFWASPVTFTGIVGADADTITAAHTAQHLVAPHGGESIPGPLWQAPTLSPAPAAGWVVASFSGASGTRNHGHTDYFHHALLGLYINSRLIGYAYGSTGAHDPIACKSREAGCWGHNEVPPNDSQAFAAVSFVLDSSDNSFAMAVSVHGISWPQLLVAQICVGSPGETGTPIFDLGPPPQWDDLGGLGISRIITDWTFPAQYLQDLLAGNTYLSIATQSYPDGEIRGQLVEPATVLWDSGAPHQVIYNGQTTYLGYSSGNLAGMPQRWAAVPFRIPPGGAVVSRIDADWFISPGYEAQTVNYIIWQRTGLAPPLPGDERAVGALGPYAPGVDDPRTPDPDDWLHLYDGLNISLPEGDYYFTLYAAGIGPGNTTGFSDGPWLTGGDLQAEDLEQPFLWRSASFPTPGFEPYDNPAIQPTSGQDPDDRWNPSFAIYGTTNSADIPAGIDLFTTPGCGTSHQDFSQQPIPPGFFDPGSDPFAGMVCFGGQPLSTDPPGMIFPADTVVQRLDGAQLPTVPSQDTIPIEIVALNLVSCNPITVTYNGGQNPEPWNVGVCLSNWPQQTGSMTITKTESTGGTFTATLPVQPKLIFTRPSDGAVRILDTGAFGIPPLDFNSSGTWVHTPDPVLQIISAPPGVLVDGNCDGVWDPALPGTTNFFPGVREVSCATGSEQRKRLTEEEALLAQHGILPAQYHYVPDSDGDCLLDDADNCPSVFNPLQEDMDGDSVGDVCDNCPTVYNPCQEDSNGNGIGDACEATFDHFTELFPGTNDLDNLSLVFTPNGSADFYAGCVRTITQLPTDPAGGTSLTLTDDSFAPVSVGGGQTVKLYGVSYSTLYVGSNGYITFNTGDTNYNESLVAHFDRPRVSALFDDLNPGAGGTVSWKQIADRIAVTWQNVPEYGTTDQNTFQVELFFSGEIAVSYLAIAATDGLAGLSAGNGLDPGFVMSDLSAMDPCPAVVCPGDLNCDQVVNFGDINPFVQYLASFAQWQATYPDCPPQNGDINGDGSYPSFGDINPFVSLIVQSPIACAP